MRTVSKRRRREKQEYGPERAAHLTEHPLCQLTIARYRLDERRVLEAWAAWKFNLVAGVTGQPVFQVDGLVIPYATEIHHRNKCYGARLTDRRWFASASRFGHDWVEGNKTQARAEGFLLPLEADPDGRLPDGSQCLTTDEWIAERAKKRG